MVLKEVEMHSQSSKVSVLADTLERQRLWEKNLPLGTQLCVCVYVMLSDLWTE